MIRRAGHIKRMHTEYHRQMRTQNSEHPDASRGQLFACFVPRLRDGIVHQEVMAPRPPSASMLAQELHEQVGDCSSGGALCLLEVETSGEVLQIDSQAMGQRHHLVCKLC